ncbi:VanW family protein [Clostridium aminobutyricum]|uniref:VanW family protein n=1 Tax=Clostridium aminobutyricum TaxID=33953 RepID=A0A939D6A9_CLOAM|nr:VanW family protein [Clostridium aminobutyricum]MBN7772314.1 VanW family protein [Clostridium aminobutyricum]
MKKNRIFDKTNIQPKKRSKLRLTCGKLYFTYKRYWLWNSTKFTFATQYKEEFFPSIIHQHKSLLLRQLKEVDMQYQYNKIINLKIAAKKLNGLVILPGETFSYWKTIGKPSAKKGYVDGMVLNGGNFKSGMGGGLCQMSNLIYWMTLHTPLTIVERYRHSFDVFPDSNRTLPFGSGATCVYPYRDLMITNETPITFQLFISVGQEYLEGQWRASHELDYKYKIIEKNHNIKAEYWGGYSRNNELYREKYDLEKKLIGTEYITENHALMMYAPFLENKGGQYEELI